MAKLTELLRDRSTSGDYGIIARLYNEKHRRINGETISSSYVGKILRGERNTESDSAREVMEITKKYLLKKRRMEKTFMRTVLMD